MSLVVRALHLATLTAFAVAQPLFDILARHAEFFAVRRSEPIDLFTLCFVLIVIVPIPALAVTGLASWFNQKTRRNVQTTLVSLLCSVILLPILTAHIGLEAIPSICIALSTGVILGLVYTRWSWVRQMLTFASIALLLFPALFLLDPAVRKITFPEDTLTYETQEINAKTPIVLVIFDSFPTTSLLNAQQEIDAEMFPNFAKLAEESVWFRNATTVSEKTLDAVPATLTGRYPGDNLHPTLYDYPRNLYTLLQDVYQVHVLDHQTNLDPGTQTPSDSYPTRLRLLFTDLKIIFLHILLPESWKHHLPPISQSWENFGDSENKPKRRGRSIPPVLRSAEFLEFIERITPSVPRSLWAMHVMHPHTPHKFYPSGRVYSLSLKQPSGQGNQAGRWVDDELVTIHAYQRHLLQAKLVDNLTGKLISKLKETGLWDSAVIIITADHGVSFHPGDSRRGLTDTNFADILSVPFFVRAPGQEIGRISDANVQNMDVLPTIMDLLGISTAWEIDGISVFDPSVNQHTQRNVYRSQTSGGLLAIPPGLAEARHKSASRKLAIFGESGADRPFRIGPHANLLGRNIESFSLDMDNSPIAAGLRNPQYFKNISNDRQFIPGEITGSVERQPPGSGPLWIVVAVNGVIQAVTRPYIGDNDSELAVWAAIVPESSFRVGSNKVDLFTLELDDPQEIRLRKFGPL
jgi:hypothetical protein